MYLGLNIKYLRKRNKMTQDELGDILGVKRSQISSYESDESELGWKKLMKIADAFQVDIRDLILTDLSKDAPEFEKPSAPYGNQDEGNVLEELNNEMRKRLVIYEQKIKELDPELAKKWGIE